MPNNIAVHAVASWDHQAFIEDYFQLRLMYIDSIEAGQTVCISQHFRWELKWCSVEKALFIALVPLPHNAPYKQHFRL